MRENTSVAVLSELKKRTIVGRMTIGIDLGDKKNQFCILNDQAPSDRLWIYRRVRAYRQSDGLAMETQH